MTRQLLIGCLSLSLTACAGQQVRPAIEYRYAEDLPDEELVAACPTDNRDFVTNGDMFAELTRNRKQRDDCAAQVNAARQWRDEARARVAARNKTD